MSRDIPKSIQFVKGVGPRWADKFAKLNIFTVEDLLYYFPRTYEDRSKLEKIRFIKPGQEVTVAAKVLKISERKYQGRRSVLTITFSDETDVLNGIWFNQSFLKKQFKKGNWYILNGKVNEKSWGKFRKKEFTNPVFEEVTPGDNIHTGRIVPIYSLTKGITQKRIRQIIYYALKDYACHIKDVLPGEIKDKYKLINIIDSIYGLHFPKDRQHYINARKRVAFEELFFLQLLALNSRNNILQVKGIKHTRPDEIIEKFLSSLSFQLTKAQINSWQEIQKDMELERPMQRLLQGDVGSGKTIIAALALVETMSNGFQGVFMAPTEILAEQHYLKLKDLLSPLGFEVSLLIGGIKQNEREKIEEEIKNNKVDLIIGTHALFQESIEYHNIGLIVIDEQHRFGVDQRSRLIGKGQNPDTLVMTATPIPRSLALTLYGDLDFSTIDELPPGRSPVITTWRDRSSRNKIYEFVKDKLKEGRQVYIVCPLIEPSADIDAFSASEVKEELESSFLMGFKLGLLHSKLGSDEKKAIMEDFRKGKIDALVSTTVVEVGVDVANASVMVIENAERFGLAQLHQLRGRVGRGKYQSFCILIANTTTEESRKRLQVITDYHDGFLIAEEDLKIRGPGEFFGTRQHGIPDLKVADIIKDQRLLNIARKEAGTVVNQDQWEKSFPELKEKIDEFELTF